MQNACFSTPHLQPALAMTRNLFVVAPVRSCYWLWLLGLVWLPVYTASAADDAPPESLLAERTAAMRNSLVGSWSVDVGKQALYLTLRADGSFRSNRMSGNWTVTPQGLELTPLEGEPVQHSVEFQAGVLVLGGGGLPQPLRFTRGIPQDSPWAEALQKLRSFKPSVWRERLVKVTAIIAIALLGIAFIKALRLTANFLVMNKRSPLRYLVCGRQSQTRTIILVVLNLLTYIILLTALGRVLGEFGVNYTAYFASLSVIGLAISFGSQGLVQDLVTGIFIILDNQFSVGDMVEITGQSGRVEVVGLRTTRIRNYLGQTVIIPNRNIAMIANYGSGALRAQIDLAIPDKAAADKLREPLDTMSAELFRQFNGTILSQPSKVETVALKTGERFLRLRLELWPQQQTLVDAQILPRLRELCAANEVEIPGNRIAVTYAAPTPVAAGRWPGWREGP